MMYGGQLYREVAAFRDESCCYCSAVALHSSDSEGRLEHAHRQITLVVRGVGLYKAFVPPPYLPEGALHPLQVLVVVHHLLPGVPQREHLQELLPPLQQEEHQPQPQQERLLRLVLLPPVEGVLQQTPQVLPLGLAPHPHSWVLLNIRTRAKRDFISLLRS